jgi:hypothetical protein
MDGFPGPPGPTGAQGTAGINGTPGYTYLVGPQTYAADTRPASEQRILEDLYTTYDSVMMRERHSSNRHGFEVR